MLVQRVLINAYFYGRPFGFGRFLIELCRSLGHSRDGIEYIAAVPAGIDTTMLPVYPHLTWRFLPKANLILWDQVMIPYLAWKLSCDLIHYPCNTTALFTLGIPRITTVLDLIFLKKTAKITDKKAFISENYVILTFKHFLKRSKAVISISRCTQDLLSNHGIMSSVVYCTADGFVSSTALAQPHAGRRYLLHRGGFAEHKNTRRVIEAFRLTKTDFADVDLKILGAPDGATILDAADDPRIQFLPRVTDLELASLYKGSSGVLVTSLQEGFGLPIIEAFGFGAPVITSDVDPMREVAGNAALLVDPYDHIAISAAMIALLSNAAMAQDLRSKGYDRAETFSSDRIARQLGAIYRQAIGREGSIGSVILEK